MSKFITLKKNGEDVIVHTQQILTIKKDGTGVAIQFAGKDNNYPFRQEFSNSLEEVKQLLEEA